MSKRVIPTPIKQGSRTPEEIREAVRKVMAERSEADWEFLRSHPLDPPPDERVVRSAREDD
jgi:hypothetical protein